jgi:hypothetical protein
MTNGQNWTCPFCNRPQTLTEGQSHLSHEHLYLKAHKYGNVGVTLYAIACANPECGEVTATAIFAKDVLAQGWHLKEPLENHKLRPRGAAKPQPEYIPEQIKEDYYEACGVLDLSAKSSATLSRRCLQGMIRDFCGISKNRLIDEINALDQAVAAGKAPLGVLPDTVEAIDHVRSIGNIGAHMEKDVNLIIPVDPSEAQALIELLELLFEEWYVAREQRRQKLARVKKIADEKDSIKNSASNTHESKA